MIGTTSPLFVLDTSVLTQSARLWYAPDICPGFWDCIAHHVSEGRLIIVDWAKQEVMNGSGPPRDWMKQIHYSLIASTRLPEISSEFGQLMQWVQNNPQFMAAAKSQFASVGDGWVIAYAKAKGLTVVSQEVYAADARKRVPIPNVCKQFNVPHLDMFDCLRQLGARFDWSNP